MAMKSRFEANGLELVTLQSKADPVAHIAGQELYATLAEKLIHRAFVVAWLDYKVEIGLWDGSKLGFHDDTNLDLKYVQRMRVFNSEQELHVWRTNGVWKCRLRQDGEGEDVEAVVAHQLLFGTRGERLLPQYARIEEDRGTKLVLPLANVAFDDKGMLKERVFIKTHNYIKLNAVYQATYFDCRFVAFTDGRNDLT